MFDTLFGWRKASKCKKLIKRVQSRLKLLKNKRHAMVRQLRQDMAQLIKLGYEETAFHRAEQLFKDECAISVYEMLDNFCEFVIINLSYIRKHKDVPNNVNEAVSSLIFASARCGDLPELPLIRELFGERYGQRFATAAVDLLPGNLVNREVKEKLSTIAVSDGVKYRLVDEIAKDLWPEVRALEYTSEPKHQEQGSSGERVPNTNIPTSTSTNEGTNLQTLYSNDNPMFVDQHLTTQSGSHSNSEAISISVCSSIVQQSSPENLESSVHSEAEKEKSPVNGGRGDTESHKPVRIDANILNDREERKKAASSPERSPHFPEEMIVFLDDVEEFRSSTKDGDLQDQRPFMFKSHKLPEAETEASVDSGNESSVSLYQQKLDKSVPGISREGENSSNERSRTKSLSDKDSTKKYADYETYYSKPSHKHRTKSSRRVRKKITAEEVEESTQVQKISVEQPCSVASGANCQLNGCTVHATKPCCKLQCNHKTKRRSLEQSCYFCSSNEEDEQKDPKWNKCEGPTSLKPSPVCNLGESSGNSIEEVRDTDFRGTIPRGSVRRRSCEHVSEGEGDKIFTWPTNEQRQDVKFKVGEDNSPGYSTSSNSSSPGVSCSKGRNKNPLPTYSRAMTMPQERPNSNIVASYARTNSCPFQNSNHVHPKLPNYDEIAAKFSALKEHCLQNKKPCNDQ